MGPHEIADALNALAMGEGSRPLGHAFRDGIEGERGRVPHPRGMLGRDVPRAVHVGELGGFVHGRSRVCSGRPLGPLPHTDPMMR